jgi:transposase
VLQRYPNVVESSFRDCPKRCLERVARYSTEHEKSIPNRPLRCRMVLHRAPPPSTQSPRTPQLHTLREILNAIFYIARSGCQWRLLPHDFPPWKTVHHYLRTWRKDGPWERVHAALRERLRVRLKRDPQPPTIRTTAFASHR